ncbi:MAG: hypothetical protein WCW02_02365 [Candidatus Buchananbacteria bacterium]
MCKHLITIITVNGVFTGQKKIEINLDGTLLFCEDENQVKTVIYEKQKNKWLKEVVAKVGEMVAEAQSLDKMPVIDFKKFYCKNHTELGIMNQE